MKLERTIFAHVDDVTITQCHPECMYKERLQSGVTKCKQFKRALKYSDSLSHHSRCEECQDIFADCRHDVKQE